MFICFVAIIVGVMFLTACGTPANWYKDGAAQIDFNRAAGVVLGMVGGAHHLRPTAARRSA